MTVVRDFGASCSNSNGYTSFIPNVDVFVNRLGGDRVIKRVLVANNGIAAVKVIRSIRKWSYATFGNDREVRTIKALCFSRSCSSN